MELGFGFGVHPDASLMALLMKDAEHPQTRHPIGASLRTPHIPGMWAEIKLAPGLESCSPKFCPKKSERKIRKFKLV